MAVVRLADKRKLFWAAPALALLAVTGCIFAIYIDLDAYEEDGAIWFDDPNRSWFTSYCLVYVTVTEIGEGGRDSRVVWNASRETTSCLADFPFRYGVREAPHKSERYTAPEDLQPGRRYEIQVEMTNGAGSGTFEIAEDGTILNTD